MLQPFMLNLESEGNLGIRRFWKIAPEQTRGNNAVDLYKALGLLPS